MAKRSTQLKIAFFGLLLAGFIVIQYGWFLSLQKEKLQDFKFLIIKCIDETGKKISSTQSSYTAITKALQQSFAANGLNHLPFALTIDNDQPASGDFDHNLTLSYVFSPAEEKKTSIEAFTVLIPSWKSYAWPGMIWLVAASVLLTSMLLIIFCYSILGAPGQQLFYASRTNAVQTMMQRLEVPLSTVSVAAEALRNARVMHDTRKIHYYQQIIDEENRRMNAEVEKFLKAMK